MVAARRQEDLGRLAARLAQRLGEGDRAGNVAGDVALGREQQDRRTGRHRHALRRSRAPLADVAERPLVELQLLRARRGIRIEIVDAADQEQPGQTRGILALRREIGGIQAHQRRQVRSRGVAAQIDALRGRSRSDPRASQQERDRRRHVLRRRRMAMVRREPVAHQRHRGALALEHAA